MDASNAERPAPDTDGGDPGVPARRRRPHSVLLFALAVPVTVLILTGVVDVSMNYSEGLQARNGTADAGRDLAAHRLDVDGKVATDCWLDDLTSSPGPVRAEACLVKSHLHVDPRRTRVRIVVVDAEGRWSSHRSPDDSIIVCTQVMARSVSGLLGVAFAGRVHQQKVIVGIDELESARIESSPIDSAPIDNAPIDSARIDSTWERPAPGTGWDWCRPDTPAP